MAEDMVMSRAEVEALATKLESLDLNAKEQALLVGVFDAAKRSGDPEVSGFTWFVAGQGEMYRKELATRPNFPPHQHASTPGQQGTQSVSESFMSVFHF
jgi:hypothetical protein